MFKILDGNTYNVPVSTWYAENLSDLQVIADQAVGGSLIEYHGKKSDGTSDFRIYMVREDHTYDEI